MKSAKAIVSFMNKPGNRSDMDYPRVTLPELKEFKSACSIEEYRTLGKQACEAIGEVFDG